ncbi:MAG TPA: peptidoglycan DD-metalloendopeptidase family protein [Solirubrobacterales bacterium]|nr:peptidoglycan DD-metalloendopeptidase family protein [Solirubrobacterales bacterium]
MARNGPGAWLRLIGTAIVAVLAALLVVLPGAATATTGGAASPGGGKSPPPSPSGSPAEEPSAGALTLTFARTAPRTSFFYGYRYPHLHFTIGSDQPQNDLRIDVVDAAGEVVQTFFRNDVAPNTTTTIRWDGTTADGRPAPNGRYRFRVGPQSGGPLARPSSTSETTSLGFALYRFAFPVAGPHDFGGPADRFGAPRAGHTHQGQDVLAACDTPLVAARGGTVQYAGFEANAGNYIVIDGVSTGFDMVYMHLREPSPLKKGMTVRTGQPIGVVGQTGDATACHLHFEIWTAPGWYEGGHPIDPLPFLERWDRYS